MRHTTSVPFRVSAIAAAICAALSTIATADDTPAARDAALRRDLATPEHTISLGIGHLSGEHRRFGTYSGLADDGFYGLLDVDLVRRGDDGTWLKLRGRNLGLDIREARLDHERQGDWGYTIEHRQWQRNDPLIVNTSLQGIGSGAVTVSNSGVLRGPVDLRIEHQVTTLGTRRYFGDGYSLRVSFRQDDKQGDRLFGRGTNTAIEFLAEPLDRATRQWEIVAARTAGPLQISGGYLGSSFENRIPTVDIVAGGAAALAGANPIDPIALPPDNDAHQLFVSAGYNFTATTRSTVKASYERATQNDAFISGVARLAGSPASLDGEVVTTRLFADLTTQPLERLDLTANLRFDDRDDRTPVVQYLNPVATSPAPGLGLAGTTGFNVQRSLRTLNGTVEAAYALDGGHRVIGSLEREEISRDVPAQFRRIGYREKTDETTARIELKRMLSETLNGSLAYLYGERGGSEYAGDTYDPAGQANYPTNLLHPLIWADRSRDKLRAAADWLPAEDWSLQFIADLAQDRYSGRLLGPREGTASFVSVDANYVIDHRWTLSGWVSRERVQVEQETHSDYNTGGGVPPNNGVLWSARLKQTTTALGLSLRGRPMQTLAVGADLAHSFDRAEHDQERSGGIGLNPGNGAPTTLPDYRYRATTVKLFADYTLDRQSGVRADLVVDRRDNDDWTWRNWVYSAASDGTTVTSPTDETAVFVGVRYRYRWR
jgi:MtrB/PioB family decaheme-associated outer membrane protein